MVVDIDQYAWLFSLPLVATAAVGCVWVRRRGCAPSSPPLGQAQRVQAHHPNQTESPLRLANVLASLSMFPAVGLTMRVSLRVGLSIRAASLAFSSRILLARLLRLCLSALIPGERLPPAQSPNTITAICAALRTMLLLCVVTISPFLTHLRKTKSILPGQLDLGQTAALLDRSWLRYPPRRPGTNSSHFYASLLLSVNPIEQALDPVRAHTRGFPE